MSDLKNTLIRLGSTNPELRPHLRPILAELDREAARTPRIAGWNIVDDGGGIENLTPEGLKTLRSTLKRSQRFLDHMSKDCVLRGPAYSRKRGTVELQIGIRGPLEPELSLKSGLMWIKNAFNDLPEYVDSYEEEVRDRKDGRYHLWYFVFLNAADNA